MSALQVTLDEYLGVRRALGARLKEQGRLLQQSTLLGLEREPTSSARDLTARMLLGPAGQKAVHFFRSAVVNVTV